MSILTETGTKEQQIPKTGKASGQGTLIAWPRHAAPSHLRNAGNAKSEKDADHQGIPSRRQRQIKVLQM
jgi:hypothetical protein